MIQDAPEFYSFTTQGEKGNIRYFGLAAGQNIYAFPAFSLMLDVEMPERIVELGCGIGGLTLYIGLWAKSSGKKLYAYDNRDARQLPELWDMLGMKFDRTDYYAKQEEIGQIIASEGKTILMCDGGNKVQEINTFSTYLKRDDIIMAHDYHSAGTPARDVDGGTIYYHWGWCEITRKAFDNIGSLEPVHEKLLETAAWGAFRRL